MSRIDLAFDFDGVVTEPHELKAVALAARGYRVGAALTSRESCLRLGVPVAVYEAATREVNCDRLCEVPLAPGIHAALGRITASGLACHLVTRRLANELAAVRAYLAVHRLPFVSLSNSSRGSKSAALREIDPVVFVDDTPSELEALRDEVGAARRIELALFRNLANRADPLPEGIREVAGGWEALSALARLAASPPAASILEILGR